MRWGGGWPDAFGRDRFRVELQRPFWRSDRARNRWLEDLAGRLGVRLRGDGRRPHARPVASAAPGCPGRRAPEGDAGGDGARAAGECTRPISPRRRRWPPASASTRSAVAETARIAERLELRPHPRPRLPLPGLGGPRRRPDAGRDLQGPARSPVRGRARAPGGAATAGGGARGDPLAAAVGVLPAPLRHPRAGARGGGRGQGAGFVARRPPPRPGPRLERQLDRLLPHRALACRPGAQRAVPGALLERGDHRGAGHRPRLSARHPREADSPRPRALRRGALGAGRGVRLLPVAQRHPRLRQGAGPAAGGGRASGPHGRPVRPPRVGRSRT